MLARSARWFLWKLGTMPHGNNPNDVGLDFIKNQYGEMITSRWGRSGNSGMILPDSGKFSSRRNIFSVRSR
jgi:hypothetical protein